MPADGRDDRRDGSSFVVVPRRVGPIVNPDARSPRPRDELDDAIDELLPDVAEGPGAFDLVLGAIGAVLIGWRLAGGPDGALAAGGAAVAIALVLPIRALWRRARSARAGRVHRSLEARGTRLDVSTVEVRALIEAHDRLRSIAGGLEPAPALAVEAAAHAALAEVAALLAGAPPATDAAASYTHARTRAMDDLVEGLTWGGADPGVAGEPTGLELRARAVAEIDALGGPNSLTRLAELRGDPETRRDEP